ncbi:Gx transporter family protein, partial [Streptococcus hyovaginalis]
MPNSNRKLMFITMLVAQAVVISFFERFIPTPFAFAPGAKLGLGNLITIISIFTLPLTDSAKVVSFRLLVSTFLSGTFSTFLYGFAGTL